MNLERARLFFDTVESHPSTQKDAGSGQAAPHHIAFTMDGNRRWARANGVPALRGHRQGAEALRNTIDAAIGENIPWLTFYAFSTENWNRSSDEIDALMGLARNFSGNHLEEFHSKGARLQVIGERRGLDAKLVESIEEAEELTKNNDVVQVNLAFNYSGRYDITRAVKQIAHKIADGKMAPDEINAFELGAHLSTGGMPPPDLLIRTGGEQRLSNFLLWESAYSELLFLDVLWPDFDAEALREAIELFRQRTSRAGAYPNRAAGA